MSMRLGRVWNLAPALPVGRGALAAIAIVSLGSGGLACSKPDTMTATLPSASASSSAALPPVLAPSSPHALPPAASNMPNPHVGPNAMPTTSAGAANAPAGGSEDLTWQAPGTWTSLPSPNSMRKATYKVPRAPGDAEDGDLSVTQVGGDLESNITRWVGQFEGEPKPKRSELMVGKLKVTVVELSGTYLGGMGSGAKKERTTMLVAVVHTEPAHFFKLVGSDKTVALARRDFDQLVKSFKVP